MLGQECGGTVRAITGAVDAACEEAVIHDDHRKGAIACGHIHHACDRQPIAGIVDQESCVFVGFIER